MCEPRIRVPEQWWGDYLAVLGAARIGERELLRSRPRGRLGHARRHAEAWFDYSERADDRRDPPPAERPARSAPATIRSPGVPEGIPIGSRSRSTPRPARIEVDLRDNPDCQPCGLNLSEACARTAAMIGVFNGIADHTVPPNAGSFRRLSIHLRENCVVGIPRHPHSCSVATTNLADRVSSPVQRALAEIADGFGMAEGGPIFPAGRRRDLGTDPRRDRRPSSTRSSSA